MRRRDMTMTAEALAADWRLRRAGRLRRCRIWRRAGQHHHPRANLDSIEEILDVRVGQPDAARRYEGADGRGLVSAVDAIERVAEIERARAKRIALATGHEARQVRLTLDHFLGRKPVRPFLHAADALGAGPCEAFAADADAVAQSLAVAHDQIKVGVRRIDH